jgi:3-dehydroquinate synthetase/shikimate kinase
MTPERTQIVLAGPPGVGKTTIAERVAQKLGTQAVDLDRAIESRTQRAVPTMLEQDGEPAFRRVEADTLAALDRSPGVIALGGGSLTNARSRSLARDRGPVFGLEAEVPTLEARLTASGVRRPLLKSKPLSELVAERQSSYRAVDRPIAASADPDTVAAEVIAQSRGLRVLVAEVGAERTRVVVGAELEGVLRGALASLAPQRPILLIEDGGVPAQDRDRYARAAAEVGPVVRIEVSGGEATKDWSRLGDVLARAIESDCGRQSAIVGLGGGATTDFAGMVAALLGRGAPLVLVPSTLLAQADASVGGKCAVNHAGERNLVGTFHPATDVISDLRFLDSLSVEELRSGLAEMLKIGIIKDAALFDELTHTPKPGIDAISRAIAHKAEIVASDPREIGDRKLLNLGHTLGHALEAATQFGLRHGEAVSIGIAAVARLSAARGWCSDTTARRIADGLRAVGLPTHTSAQVLNDAIFHLGRDKKAGGGMVDLIRVHELGKVSLFRVSLQEIGHDLVQAGGSS